MPTHGGAHGDAGQVGQTGQMSPVSRGRKGSRKGRKNNKSIRRPLPPAVLSATDACDCSLCSGEDFDPRRLIDELTAGAADLVASEDPLEAEIAGAAFVSIGAVAGEGFDEALLGGFIPAFEAQASTEALAMLLAIGSVTEGRAGKAASAAVDRLVQAGLTPPGWMAELREPVRVADCWRLSDSQKTASMLACSFHRAGRSHAVLISVNHLECGAADEITLLEADQLPAALEMIRAGARADGVELTQETLKAGEFRWQVEKALEARAVHDHDQPDLATPDLPIDADGLPDYPALAVLLRARMKALPTSRKPAASHGDTDEGHAELTTGQILARLAEDGDPVFGARTSALSRGRTMPGVLPATRANSDRPAPIYQIKVGLRGTKPPIWRRLQVPADISLARLHTIIQIAFDWYDSHLHVFETPYGEFGTADAELGHHAEAPVTFAQVAPGVGSKIRYTYDFGDDWEHTIVVEKVFDRDETVNYPRCTGGRRAAPPEDCGGIWGYADLTEVLADPTHPEHEDRLEWLGLSNAADFDPASFDAQAVTQALSRLC